MPKERSDPGSFGMNHLVSPATFRFSFLLVLFFGLSFSIPALASEPFSSGTEVAPVGSGETQIPSVPLSGRKFIDTAGQIHRLGEVSNSRGSAFVFIDTECPIANAFVPELNRLALLSMDHEIEFYGVMSSPDISREQARKHGDEYEIKFPVLFDASGDLARLFSPTHVPEAFVVSREGSLVYRGRVNDSYAALTKRRPKVSRHDLRDAITKLAAGEVIAVPRTEPVGCFFESWTSPPQEREPLTYTRDIAPIINANCVECHRDGEVAPFSLGTYADVRRRARLLAHVVKAGTMPPWSPAEGHGNFLDARRLTVDEIKRIEDWAALGAPYGPKEELPSSPRFPEGWQLGEPDLVLEVPESFDVPADGGDIFRCFVLPTGLTEDKEVIAVEFEAGSPTVVHHALFYLDNRGLARKLDEADEGPGYSRFGGPGFPPSGALGGWAPGAQPITYPDGMGRRLNANEDLVLQIHYHPSGKAEKDRSRMAIYFSQEPLKHIVRGTFMGQQRVDIPAGEANHELRSSMTLPAEMTLVRITPHMHLLGKEMKVIATHPDGREEPLIWIPKWDFNWQGQYRYVTPVRLPKGTKLDLYASYDNSEANPFNPSTPPRRVTYGEQTTDEMCFCFYLFTTESETERSAIRRAAWRSFVTPSR